MTKTPEWLPDGSGIDPESLRDDVVVVTENGFWFTADEWKSADHAPIVRVYADVTPPRPDRRVEAVARVLHQWSPSHSGTCDDENWSHWCDDARAVLDALDAIGGQK